MDKKLKQIFTLILLRTRYVRLAQGKLVVSYLLRKLPSRIDMLNQGIW